MNFGIRPRCGSRKKSRIARNECYPRAILVAGKLNMAVVYVNGNTVDIGTERLNLIQAAERGGVFIPSYCWHPALTVVASCRMCLVEVGDKKPDGTVAMQPRVVPGCQTSAKDGTVIVTNSAKAKAAQQQTLEELTAQPPARLPRLRQSRRVPAARLQLPLWPQHQPDDRRQEPTAQ